VPAGSPRASRWSSLARADGWSVALNADLPFECRRCRVTTARPPSEAPNCHRYAAGARRSNAALRPKGASVHDVVGREDEDLADHVGVLLVA